MTDSRSLRLSDLALVVGYCVVLFSFPLVYNRTLTTHESVHCQNVREMSADRDWVIPHYGSRPWLERPPLPFWLTMPVIGLTGDHPVSYRLASALVALPCVLIVGWMASLWFGRAVGILSALVLATMRQFNHYATGPEADIFLCTVVTSAIGLFIYLEFRCRPATERWLIGRRPWALLAFFFVLGLANLVKGLFFGDAFILLPIACFLFWGDDRLSLLRRYFWLPGWLVFLSVGSAWAVAAYLRHPDVADLWFSDYGGRLNTHYMREPIWYYLAHLPSILFPWSVPALLGLWLTRREALCQGRTPERFLWCWAIVPLVFFSLPSGKHQHYLLQAMAPWAVLGALGGVRLWQWCLTLSWLRSPWRMMLVVGLPLEIALVVVVLYLKAPGWFAISVLIAWPALLLASWFAVTRKDGRVALAATFALCAVICWTMHAQTRLLHDRYAGDCDFVRQVKRELPVGAKLLVLDDWGPLDASWLLFHLGMEGCEPRLLHNVTFLATQTGDEVFVVARRYKATHIGYYGECEEVFGSEYSRGESSPKDRLALYRLRLRNENEPAREVYISPMQATGRAAGPFIFAPVDHTTQQTYSSPTLLSVPGR